jgi:hypothetical protein
VNSAMPPMFSQKAIKNSTNPAFTSTCSITLILRLAPRPSREQSA